MTTEPKQPAHLRLHEFDVKHLLRVLTNCKGGSIGFDPHRNPETNSKDKLIDYLLANFTPEQIDEAHAEAVKGYKGKPSRGRRSRSVEPAEPHKQPYAPTVKIDDSTQEQVIEVEAVEVKAEPVKNAPAIVPQTEQETAQQLANLISKLSKPQVDPSQIEDLIATQVKAAIEKQAVRHIIEVPTLEPVEVGTQHKHFSQLLKMCNARNHDGTRLNVWLVGDKGTGKTHAAKSISDALSLPFYAEGALDQGYKLTGYLDANGGYKRTAFREAYENGGVFLLDELDASHPSVTLELNAALSSSWHRFPDQPEPVARHADCVIIASANTHGQGATAEFNGRSKQDAAFLDRFTMLDWPLDEALERALCGNVEWCARVQTVRAAASTRKLRGYALSMRATSQGEALLAAGLTQKQVEQSVLRKGLPTSDWQAISA